MASKIATSSYTIQPFNTEEKELPQKSYQCARGLKVCIVLNYQLGDYERITFHHPENLCKAFALSLSKPFLQFSHVNKCIHFLYFLGTVCDFRLSYGRVLNKKSKIIAVNRNREQLFKNSDLFWKPSVAIQADPATFVVRLSSMLTNVPPEWGEWAKSLKDRDTEKEEGNKKKASDEVDRYVNPVKLLHVLEDALDEDSILVADGGDFVGTAAYILR